MNAFMGEFGFKPWMCQCFLACYSFICIHCEHLSDQVFTFIRSYTPAVLSKFKLPTHNFLHYRIVIGAIERRFSTQENIHNNSKTPYITFFIVNTLQYFRRYVIDCSKLLCKFLRRIKYLTSPKINDFNFYFIFIFLFN